jgi:cell filamentation protein
VRVGDRAHLQQIHRELFREVFPWAAELRPTDLRRAGFPPFVRKEFLGVTLDNTLAALPREKHLKGSNEETFSARAAHFLGELNHVHPFREGSRHARSADKPPAKLPGNRVRDVRKVGYRGAESGIEGASGQAGKQDRLLQRYSAIERGLLEKGCAEPDLPTH